MVWQDGATGSLIQNNIFLRNAEQGPRPATNNGIDFYFCGGGHVVRNNLYFGALRAIIDTADGASYTESDAVQDDPLFVDPEAGDFELTPGSPAIDGGTGELAPDHDASCAPRPRGAAVDIGAYEVEG